MSTLYRPQPLGFCCLKFALKWGWIAAVTIALMGCSQTEVSPSGFKTFNTNFATVSWTPASFSATTVNTSTPLNSTWRGITRTADIAKDLGLALSPQTGAAPIVVKGTGILGTKFNNPPPTP